MRRERYSRLERTSCVGFVGSSGGVAEAVVANRKTKKDWGTILLQMALDARQEGDLVTAELLVVHALDYFDESDRLASRWRKFEARLGDHHTGPRVAKAPRRAA